MKYDKCDEVQLAAQVICLEEMYGIQISYAALYYNEEKHRHIIPISDSLRQITQLCADEMHRIFETGILPAAKKRSCCRSCSLRNVCLPEMEDCTKVANYLKRNLYESLA